MHASSTWSVDAIADACAMLRAHRSRLHALDIVSLVRGQGTGLRTWQDAPIHVYADGPSVGATAAVFRCGATSVLRYMMDMCHPPMLLAAIMGCKPYQLIPDLQLANLRERYTSAVTEVPTPALASLAEFLTFLDDTARVPPLLREATLFCLTSAPSGDSVFRRALLEGDSRTVAFLQRPANWRSVTRCVRSAHRHAHHQRVKLVLLCAVRVA